MSNDKHVIATFEDAANAKTAANKLQSIGISPQQVSLMVSEGGRGHHFEIADNQTKAAEGAGYGAVLGGLVAGLTAAAIPGSIFVAGPAAGAMAAGAGGAAAGGLLGCLTGLGVAEDEAKLVESDVEKGDIVLAIHSIDSDRADDVSNLMKEADAKRVH